MWTLDIASGDLYFGGDKVGRLNQSETLVLSCLVSNHDLLVSKDMLLDTGWPGKFVAPNSLTAAIKNIRQLLTSVESDIFIETVHRKGYTLKGNPEHIRLIEIVASAQIRLPEESTQEMPFVNEFVQCDEDLNPTIKAKQHIKITRWVKLKFGFKRCLYFLLSIIMVVYLLVTVAFIFFLMFKPAELYCYQINKAEFCGLFELNTPQKQKFNESYGGGEAKYYYGYDESLDEIKIYPAD